MEFFTNLTNLATNSVGATRAGPADEQAEHRHEARHGPGHHCQEKGQEIYRFPDGGNRPGPGQHGQEKGQGKRKHFII